MHFVNFTCRLPVQLSHYFASVFSEFNMFVAQCELVCIRVPYTHLNDPIIALYLNACMLYGCAVIYFV